jgi:hypothetical protein
LKRVKRLLEEADKPEATLSTRSVRAGVDVPTGSGTAVPKNSASKSPLDTV